MNDTRDIVLSFLRKTIDQDLELDTPLIETGLLDSFHVVELLSFVESQFNLRLEPTDVSQKDLACPQSIVDLVVRLRSREIPSA